MSEYTYQEYLACWDASFEDADEGSTRVWIFGKAVDRPVKRLTSDEFSLHMEQLRNCGDKYNEAAMRDDWKAMDAALQESFPHEVVLLL